MQAVDESVIVRVMESGNGTREFVPQPGGELIIVSYLWGKLGLTGVGDAFIIPKPASGVGGDDSPPQTVP